jgi:hypothetical protein
MASALARRVPRFVKYTPASPALGADEVHAGVGRTVSLPGG